MASWRGASPAIDRLLDGVPPASGAVVMGTGIVSVALSADGRELPSRILLGLATAVWAALAVLLAARAARDHARFRRDLRTPPAFTAVAGTAVLGTRLTLLGGFWAGGVLLVIALVLWLGLLGLVLHHWVTPTVGASFQLTVGTESLALLAAVLAREEHAGWLLAASLGPFLLGLGFYLFVVSDFDLRQLVIGHGDHWVTGGALAISTVTAGQIALAAERLEVAHGAVAVLRDVSVALWVLTMMWLPVLLVVEVRWPRPSYDVRRWSTVFPVGMYAACSFVVGVAAGAGAIRSFAELWVWVALIVWTTVFIAMLRRAASVLRGVLSPAGRRAAEDQRGGG